jgi:y4mF family transcriptional regulator
MKLRSIADSAAAVRGSRLDHGWSQAELARLSGVSRKWISEFETGKGTAEFVLVLRVLETLGLVISLGPGAPPAPGPDRVDLDALLDEYRAE